MQLQVEMILSLTESSRKDEFGMIRKVVLRMRLRAIPFSERRVTWLTMLPAGFFLEHCCPRIAG